MKEHSEKEYKVYIADEDAEYDEVVEIDLSKVRRNSSFSAFAGQRKDN